MNRSDDMNTKNGNILRFVAIICMVVSVLFSVFSASDVHADEIFSNPIDHVQMHENHSGDDNHNNNNSHPSGICVHSSCHHSVNIVLDFKTMAVPQFSEFVIIKGVYNAPAAFELSNRLKRPPRQ